MSAFCDIMTALGTIGACVIALYFGMRDKIKRLDIDIIWDYVTESKPTIYLYNPSSSSIAIKTIRLIYKDTEFAYKDYMIYTGLEYKGYVLPNETKVIKIENINLDFIDMFNSESDEKIYDLIICVTDISSKKYKKKLKIQEKEVKRQKGANHMFNS